jgi:hypothetical protein
VSNLTVPGVASGAICSAVHREQHPRPAFASGTTQVDNLGVRAYQVGAPSCVGAIRMRPVALLAVNGVGVDEIHEREGVPALPHRPGSLLTDAVC